jgi:AcrR family transcriptional regulator
MVDIVWGTKRPPSRGPKPALTPERIARAAIEIADAEGLAAVSMQRITARLGFTKMAVYRYVPAKADLVLLMIEVASEGPPDLGNGKGGWREALGRWAAELLSLFNRHPWLLEATIGPRVMGPAELSWLERALRALGETALTGSQKLDVVATIAGHVRMIAQQTGGTPDPEAQMMDAVRPMIEARKEEFPALIAAMGGERDRAFDVGLECILDGIEVLHEKRSARGPGRKPPGGAESSEQ